MHVHIFLCVPHVFVCMHVSTQGHASCVCTTHVLSPSLRGFACWVKLCSVKKQEAHLNIFTTLSSLASLHQLGEGVSDSGTPHLKHSSVHDSVSSKQTPQGDNEALFSHHSKVASCPRSSKSRFEYKWTLESKLRINIRMYHTDEQEREMIGSETGPGFESLTMPLFQPTTHTLLNRPV